MITIIATPMTNGHFALETSAPIDGRIFTQIVPSQGEAFRISHSWNRSYILEKMIKWLNQRIVALKQSNQLIIADRASDFLEKIIRYEKISATKIYQVIADSEQVISAIAPGTRSGQYGYYKKEIVKILYFCKKEIGVI